MKDTASMVLAKEQQRQEAAARKRHSEVIAESQEENNHTHLQYLLLRIGISLGYQVYAASNDHAKNWKGEYFNALTLPQLPPTLGLNEEVMNTISLIDVLWLNQEGQVECAFEVEKSTSIYSGILRLKDLACCFPDRTCEFYLVAPDAREKEVIAQFMRPAFADLGNLKLAYIPFSEIVSQCDSLCRFGEDRRIMAKISRMPPR